MLPVVRTLAAAAAGVSDLAYRRFAVASLLGSALWAAAWILAGDLLQRGMRHPTEAALAIGLAAGAAFTVRLVHRRHRTNKAPADHTTNDPSSRPSDIAVTVDRDVTSTLAAPVPVARR
jgi:membrane protein DedA with SNARE-associated domain